MRDPTERRAAIDAWKEDFKGFVNSLDMPRDDYKGIMEYIDEVPSAQPEIIHCRDCKYWEGEYIDGFWYFEECSLNQRGALSDDSCLWAERRKE